MNEKELMIIGLCGRSGSGKGYVSRIFANYGIRSIDTDAVYRDLTAASPIPSPCMSALVARFGERAALPDNSLDRAYMRDVVFSADRTALSDLNSITHQFILDETIKRTQALQCDGFNIVIIDAPLLFESGFDGLCDFTVCVVANDEVSADRITERDGITREEALARLSKQIPNDLLIEKSDFVIVNDGISNVEAQVERCAAIITDKFNKLANFSNTENKL